MLFLHFRIGDDSFALATERIVEIVPLTELRQMRQAPEGASACFDYRGSFVPAVDLCARELGRPARPWLSTRIIVVRHDTAGLVGLVAEQATGMLRLDPDAFAPFAAGPHGLIQRVEVEDLVPPTLLASLARVPAHAP